MNEIVATRVQYVRIPRVPAVPDATSRQAKYGDDGFFETEYDPLWSADRDEFLSSDFRGRPCPMYAQWRDANTPPESSGEIHIVDWTGETLTLIGQELLDGVTWDENLARSIYLEQVVADVQENFGDNPVAMTFRWRRES